MSLQVVHKNYVIDLEIGCERYSIEARWVAKPKYYSGSSISEMLKVMTIVDKDPLEISQEAPKEQVLRPYLVRYRKGRELAYEASLNDLIAIRDACEAMLNYFASEEDVEK